MTIKNKFSLLICLLFLIAGISFQELFSLKFYFSLLITTLTGVIAFLFLRKNFKAIFICSIFFFTGTIILNYQKNSYEFLQKKLENKIINIKAKVINKEINKFGKIKEEILLKIIATNDKSLINTNFNIILYLYTNTNIEHNQILLIKNLKIKNLNKKTGFKYYLIKEDINATIFAKKIDYEIIENQKNFIAKKIYEFKKNLFINLKNKINNANFGYFSSIFLGYKKEPISNQEKNLFNIWGISHYLARSGLHIVLFILIWQLILSLIPINLNFKNIILLLLVLLYTILSWSSISLLRAFYAFVFIQAGNLLNQQTKYLHLLSLTCLITLLLNPIQLFFVDFQLTYGLTFTLILIKEM